MTCCPTFGHNMKFKKTDSCTILRLERNEKIIESLTRFCDENEIKSGILHGIGAVEDAEIGFYDLSKKEYFLKKIDRPCEIVSLTGNIVIIEGKSFLHVHTVLSDENFNCLGGHLKEATVGATCEIYLFPATAEVTRELDEAIGLKLLKFED